MIKGGKMMNVNPKINTTIFIRSTVGTVTIKLNKRQVWEYNINAYDNTRHMVSKNNISLNFDKETFERYFQPVG